MNNVPRRQRIQRQKPANCERTFYTLPAEVVDWVAYEAQRQAVSQSLLVTQIIQSHREQEAR